MVFLLGRRGWLLLLVSMAPLCCADPTQSCDITAQPDFISLAHSLVLPVHGTTGPLTPLYSFARSFLDAVQPNAFPNDIVQGAVDHKQLDVSEVAGYEAGYLVCLILALLYMVLMPVLGGVFVWRHYHGNSGGITPSSPSSRRHWGIAMGTCLAVTTILLLAGVILAFNTNNRTRENMEPGLYHLRTNLGVMEKALSSIPEKIELILEQYSAPKAEMEKHFKGVGDNIGQALILAFDPEAKEALSDLSVSVQDAVHTRESLQVVHTIRSRMQPRQRLLQAQLAELRQGLEQTRTSCPACGLPSTNQLHTDAEYRMMPSVKPQLERFPPAIQFTSLVEQANASFSGIPEICKNQTAPSVKALMVNVENTRTSMNSASQQFPSLKSLSEVVSDVRHAVSIYGTHLNRYDYQRWAVAVMFCTLILLIVLLTTLGLALGLLPLCRPDLNPAHCQGPLERIAVTLLRVAVVLTLIFSWLFIILVFITLFFGGNVHTFGCRSWKRGEIFEFFDQYDGLFSSLNSSRSEDDSTPLLNLSTAEIYHGCKTGQSLFHSMEFSQLFDLEDFLNTSKYMAGFRQDLHNMSINLQDFQLLSSEGRRNVQQFRDSGIDRIVYAEFWMQLSRPVTKTNLTVFAEQLDMAAQTQEDDSIRMDLERKAGKTRELSVLVQQQLQDAKKLNASVKALSVISTHFKANINKALQSIWQIQQGLQKSVQSVVGNVSQCTLHKAKIILGRYLDWVRHTIINEILQCQWLSVSLDNVYTALCENVIDPWNAFCLCLGWCCAFLIPAVIFSLFTANYLQPAQCHRFTANDLPLASSKEESGKPEEKAGKAEPNIYAALTTIHLRNQDNLYKN
ncbi:prominin-2-like isoform X1 [Conger conger]|uniref:prominin-2-like isoform X1 n=1 Tax=Conger conger TaxID=82655 RepID=UPI002A5ADE6B|nr:prominin-2-like isoform X1 [Conger conger]